MRRRRRELGHRRIDAAEAIGACWKSVLWWERDEREPAPQFYPALIRYLGEEPWPVPVSLGERLRAERLRRGLSAREASGLVGADEGAFSWWERGRLPKHRRTKALIEAFLGERLRPGA